MKQIIINKKIINEVKELTHYNGHNRARLRLAKAIKSENYINFYKAVDVLHTLYGSMPKNLSILRDDMEPNFMRFLKLKIKNFNEVYSAL